MSKDSAEAFDKRCREWLAAIEAETFGENDEYLSSHLACEAFEARFEPSRARALKLAADGVSYLARILDERRAEETA